jgi:uncharacterized membrane protein YoaK (UPF0700 family)
MAAPRPTPPHPPDASSRETARVAVLLAWVAGAVDAIGYLTLSHIFTAHMSGNSVAFGAALGLARWDTVLERGIPIALFALGIAVGTAVGEASGARGVRHPTVAVFAIEAALLALFWGLGSRALEGGEIRAGAAWQFYGLVALPTLAMGLQSATLRRVGGRGVRTTYVSGVLTNLAEAIAQAVFRTGRRGASGDGREPRDRPTGRIRLYGNVWGAYVLGAILGGVGLEYWGLGALALPIAGLGLAMVRDLLHPHELAGDEQA